MLWPGELWELMAERRIFRRAGGMEHESRRIALFTSRMLVEQYIDASSNPSPSMFEKVWGLFADEDAFERFKEGTLLHGYDRCWVQKVPLLPIDPES